MDVDEPPTEGETPVGLEEGTQQILEPNYQEFKNSEEHWEILDGQMMAENDEAVPPCKCAFMFTYEARIHLKLTGGLI